MLLNRCLPVRAPFKFLLRFLLTASLASAQTRTGNERISLPIDEWLAQGEHKTFAWKVHVSHPSLTFQQRYRVWVTAAVDTDSLQSRSVQRDLHFVLKVANQDGKWFEGDTYNRFPIKKKFDQPEDITFEAGLYLQPGFYTVAVLIYDAVLEEHNTSFTHVNVKAPGNDQFPKMLDGLPKVEFLPTPVEGLASPADGHVSLTVPTEVPVQLDLLVDLASQPPATKPEGFHPVFSPPMQDRRLPNASLPQSGMGFPHKSRMEPGEGVRRTVKGHQSQLLEAASVLSDINFPNGCTSVTVINSLSRKTLMNAQPAISADWLKTWGEVVKTDLNLVSADELIGAAKAASFLSAQVETLMKQAPRCDSGSTKATRIVGILSQGSQFPPTAPMSKVETTCGCRVFYLQQREEDDPASNFDKLPQLLAPVHPIHLAFSDPRQFRQKLAEFVKAIGSSERRDSASLNRPAVPLPNSQPIPTPLP